MLQFLHVRYVTLLYELESKERLVFKMLRFLHMQHYGLESKDSFVFIFITQRPLIFRPELWTDKQVKPNGR